MFGLRMSYTADTSMSTILSSLAKKPKKEPSDDVDDDLDLGIESDEEGVTSYGFGVLLLCLLSSRSLL